MRHDATLTLQHPSPAADKGSCVVYGTVGVVEEGRDVIAVHMEPTMHVTALFQRRGKKREVPFHSVARWVEVVCIGRSYDALS